MKSFKGLVPGIGDYTNTYVVYDEVTKDGIVIDLANNLDSMTEFVDENNINIKYVVLTHCHADHIDGIKNIKDLWKDAKVLIHEKDFDSLTDNDINLTKPMRLEPNFTCADITLKDGDEIKFGDVIAKVLHTPGHTSGSISLLVDDALFSGDTLFKGTVGRTDLPTGSAIDMQVSLRKLLNLPGNTIVYPGHGFGTMIMDEK